MDQLQKLHQQLKLHDDLYFNKADPIISDSDYDQLRESCRRLEKQLKIPLKQRYTNTLGNDHTTGFQQVKHYKKMLSLEKGFSKQDLQKFSNRITKIVTDAQFVVEHKFDGISVAALYRNGKLLRAVTRGDGVSGDIITKQVQQCGCLPNSIVSTELLEVRGEILLPIAEFNKINNLLKSNGKKLLANTRNACAGIMKRKEISSKFDELNNFKLRCVVYEIIRSGTDLPKLHLDQLNWLKQQGFDTSQGTQAKNITDAFDICSTICNHRNELDYDIDGAVIKLNQTETYCKFGKTQHHPKWAIAYKFPTEKVSTELLNIVVEVGKSGQLTPVGHLRPVHVAGTMVSKVSLHNFDEIKRLGVNIGDIVEVEKAGEIIPHITKVVQFAKDHQNYIPPDKCPKCNELVTVQGPRLFCTNGNCGEMKRNKLVHFCSKKAMDIKGLSAKTIDRISTVIDLKSPADLYKLTKNDLQKVPRMGPKSIQNILSAIEASKQRGLARVLAGLSLKHVGNKLADDLAMVYKDIDVILTQSKKGIHEFTQLDGVSELTATSLTEQFNSPEFIKLIQQLKEHGVQLTSEKVNVVVSNNFFTNKTFVITGTFTSGTRAQVQQTIQNLGGKLTGSVSSRTNYLLIGQEPGDAKVNKARSLKVPCLTEEEFLAKISV